MISYHSLWQLQKAEHHKTDIFDHSVRLSDVNLEANVRSNGSVKTTSSNCDSRDKLLADISATPLMIFTVALFRPESDKLVPHNAEYVPTHKLLVTPKLFTDQKLHWVRNFCNLSYPLLCLTSMLPLSRRRTQVELDSINQASFHRTVEALPYNIKF